MDQKYQAKITTQARYGNTLSGGGLREDDLKRNGLQAALNLTSALLEGTESQFQRLCERLTPVIAPEAQDHEQSQSSPEPRVSPVLNSVRGINERLTRLAESMRVLTSVIDL